MAQKVVILVGPDMCGKTQIAAALSDALKIPVFKASSEHDSFMNKQELFINQLRYADTRMVDFLRQTGHSVIFDRAYPCERVYSEFYNRVTDEKILRYVDEQFADMDARIVVCGRSSFNGIQDDLDSRLDAAALMRIQTLYGDFIKWTKCKTLFLNVDDENLVRECSDIFAFLGYSKEKIQSLAEDVLDFDARRRSGQAACCV